VGSLVYRLHKVFILMVRSCLRNWWFAQELDVICTVANIEEQIIIGQDFVHSVQH